MQLFFPLILVSILHFCNASSKEDTRFEEHYKANFALPRAYDNEENKTNKAAINEMFNKVIFNVSIDKICNGKSSEEDVKNALKAYENDVLHAYDKFYELFKNADKKMTPQFTSEVYSPFLNQLIGIVFPNGQIANFNNQIDTQIRPQLCAYILKTQKEKHTPFAMITYLLESDLKGNVGKIVSVLHANVVKKFKATVDEIKDIEVTYYKNMEFTYPKQEFDVEVPNEQQYFVKPEKLQEMNGKSIDEVKAAVSEGGLVCTLKNLGKCAEDKNWFYKTHPKVSKN